MKGSGLRINAQGVVDVVAVVLVVVVVVVVVAVVGRRGRGRGREEERKRGREEERKRGREEERKRGRGAVSLRTTAHRRQKPKVFIRRLARLASAVLPNKAAKSLPAQDPSEHA